MTTPFLNRWTLIGLTLLALFFSVFWRDFYFLAQDAYETSFRTIDPRTIVDDADLSHGTHRIQRPEPETPEEAVPAGPAQ